MRYLHIYIVFIISIAFFTSCEKEIEIDLKTAEPKVVIEGLVELNRLAIVKITKTSGYNSSEGYKVVDNANVLISNDLGLSEQLHYYNDGVYLAYSIRGEAGRTYNLTVTVEEEEFTSVSTMPTFVGIDSLYLEYFSSLKEAFPMVRFQDIAGEKNYYRHKLYVNSKRINMGNSVTDDWNRDGALITRILPIDGKQLENKDEKLLKGDTIHTELICIDEGVYKYFETLGNIGMNLTNPTTNIKGGALGYFSAFTKSEQTVFADWKD